MIPQQHVIDAWNGLYPEDTPVCAFPDDEGPGIETVTCSTAYLSNGIAVVDVVGDGVPQQLELYRTVPSTKRTQPCQYCGWLLEHHVGAARKCPAVSELSTCFLAVPSSPQD